MEQEQCDGVEEERQFEAQKMPMFSQNKKWSNEVKYGSACKIHCQRRKIGPDWSGQCPLDTNERKLAAQSFFSGDLQELDATVKSMMEKTKDLIQSGTEKALSIFATSVEEKGLA